jgi:hypothetical protein
VFATTITKEAAITITYPSITASQRLGARVLPYGGHGSSLNSVFTERKDTEAG